MTLSTEQVHQLQSMLDNLNINLKHNQLLELREMVATKNILNNILQVKTSDEDFQNGKYVDKKIADELLVACEWAREVFLRLTDEGLYPKFLLAENGGEGIMPLVNAIKLATKI